MEMIKETAKVVRQQQIDEGIFDMELSFPKGAALANQDSSLQCTVMTRVSFYLVRSVFAGLIQQKEHCGLFIVLQEKEQKSFQK